MYIRNFLIEGILTQILQLPSGASPSNYAKKDASMPGPGRHKLSPAERIKQ